MSKMKSSDFYRTPGDRLPFMLETIEKMSIDEILKKAEFKIEFKAGVTSRGERVCRARSDLNLDKVPVEVFAFMVNAIRGHRVAVLNLKSEGYSSNSIELVYNLTDKYLVDTKLQEQAKTYIIKLLSKAMESELTLMRNAMIGKTSNPFEKKEPKETNFFAKIMNSLSYKKNNSTKALDF